MTALFEPDGDRLVPTDLARGPWSADALHGGPVAAVVARSVERLGGDDDLTVTRLSLELLRPVGTSPVTVASRVVRPGRRVQLVDTVVTQDDAEVAWGRSLRLQVDPALPVPPTALAEDGAPPGHDTGDEVPSVLQGYAAFHNQAVEIRFVRGAFDRRGPAAGWFRLRGPVVAGEPLSPVQRAVAVADFASGISAELDFRTSRFVNADLTVSLLRPPVGEWVCVDARTRFGAPGVGAVSYTHLTLPTNREV